MSKTAILNVADTGPLESLAVMLKAIEWRVLLPSESLKNKLREIGCDTVLNVADLVKSGSYEEPDAPLFEGLAYTDDMRIMNGGQFVLFDVKAHRNFSKIKAAWPQAKVCWYRINGGKPEHVVNARGDMGDEVNPPCPIVTPNMWYSNKFIHNEEEGWGAAPPWRDRSYACWPPFHRLADHASKSRLPGQPPICLIHNLQGWGYGALIENFKRLGIKLYGEGSPDGLLKHSEVPDVLSKALAYVHLKSNDAPGYALYEALAAGCPVICTRRLIWRCRMQDLLIPGKTCLVFDRETHEGLTADDVWNCTNEVSNHLEWLKVPEVNLSIGMAGREKLKEVMWSKTNIGHVSSFAEFMDKHFGG